MMVRTKQRIGGYRVIAPIGAGGFATVYRALNESNGQEVAIKVLAENHSLIPEARRRFADEVDLLRTVDSPAIAKIYELGETETGQPYMVLELADRGDLRRRLEEIRDSNQVLNRADLTMLAHHLYDSLTTLHRAEIVHRDVSPGNILIRSRRTPGGSIKDRDGNVTLLEPGERFLLADLGHAKDLIRASGFTAGGGTRGFASPEQRDDITLVDLRTDIFSATAIIEWAAHDGEFAEDLEPFFDIGLAAEPDDRFNSMTEWHAAFSAALGAIDDGSSGGIFSFEGLSSTVGRLPTPSRRSVTATAAVLALGGLLGFGLINQLAGRSGQTVEAESDFRSVAVSVTEARDTLLVTAAEEQVGATVAGTQPDSDATEQTTAPTTEPDPSTTESNGTTTTAPSSPSQTEEPTSTALEAEVEVPTDGMLVDGNLEISGRATFPDAVGSVELVIKNLETRRHWNPETEQFQESFLRFRLPVTGGNTDGTWQYSIPDDQIESGPYLIRVWARGPDGEDDPRSDSLSVLVS